MGCRRYSPVRMIPGNFQQDAFHPFQHLLKRFRTLQVKPVRIVIETLHLIRMGSHRIGKRHPFPGTHMDLAKIGAGLKFQLLMPPFQGKGRIHGTHPVAGIQSIQRDILKPLCQCVQLKCSPWSDLSFGRPLPDAVQIPLRLSVTNEINFSHSVTSAMLNRNRL